MFRELLHVKQNDPAHLRRCFVCEALRLTTWESAEGLLNRFRITYRKDGSRWALFCQEDKSIRHFAIDDGESSGGFYKASPQLTHAPHRDFSSLSLAFENELALCSRPVPQAEAALDMLAASSTGAG